MTESERESENGREPDAEFVRVPVGYGTPEGINSAYVLPDHGVVIDPGPPSPPAFETLTDELEAVEMAVTDVDHVVVTHWHVDHSGLATRLAREAEATVHMHEVDAPLVGDYAESRPERVDRDDRTLQQWGVPESTRDAIAQTDTPTSMPDSFPVETHDHGDTVGGVELLSTPGHTAGHLALRTHETLFLGDLLLPTYTPNVGGSDTRLDDPLGDYLTSLERLEAVADEHGFTHGQPGHGTALELAPEIADVRAHHRERAAAAFESLSSGSEGDGGGGGGAASDEPGTTPWAVAGDLFGDLQGFHAKFGAGEAAAHLERLAELGVVERLEGSTIRYRQAVEEYPSPESLTP
ncbi:MBL fold metallo-hydrolase [Natrarchaeobaculum aegyptiacum]|uniref:MBL fold metallo-hydrolase n=1 Tax=Natrarchaeobaculum aegyptiacum TaxID=745377 RepID=A0A2Z2HWJ0_9EURY|nr:MBL fold metallo-hydrolase [Natrarchaeobaculum aegyptiacum]ARS91726.1 MBL fold metallo-hydrolase [Natrarchaeobaculum aegyptiacum]